MAVSYPEDQDHERLRVLIIDDESAVTSLLTRILRAMDVTVVRDGASAIEALAGGRWDAVICDLALPDTSGPTLYHRATDAQRERFLFITGGAMTADAQRFLDLCAAPVLYKPFDASAIRRAVAAVTQKSRA
ncbi:MAG: response regulator [Deltaproteobacteria bacterium]|nr:response regulator [Deltaproteobacteria bacterium]